ncbi:MAG: hypothetical protein ACRD26_20005 [Vicinamibacterales bacterium]
MNWGSDRTATRRFDDGLGVRWLEADDREGGIIEVLEVSPALAVQDGFEAAIHARATRLADLGIEGLALVHRVERSGSALRVVAEHVEGLRLPDLLQEAIKGNIPLPQPAALELAGRVLRIVATLHRVPGMSHGAITPSHVVITRTGGVVLTDAVFGPALEAMQRNREQLWREFRLALPASASLPRFDQRADVAQLGATVLAVALGRSLREGEYPRAINEVVIAATLAARPGETGTSTSALRMWLQESLYLHPRAIFASALDAEQAYAEVLGPAAARRGGAAAFETAVHCIFGDTPASVEAAQVAAAWSSPSPVPLVGPADVKPVVPAGPPPDHVPAPARGEPRPLSSLFRNVFSTLRAS